MLQALLAERFKLAVRWTMREQPVYFLTVADDDGRLGPGLTRPKVRCSPANREASAALSQEEITKILARCGARGSASAFQGGDVALSSLLPVLEPRLMRPVVDRTGLDGSFDITLTWRPDGVPGNTSGAAVAGTSLPTVDPAAPRLVDAVEEQLGLKLELGSAPMEALVIEHIERLVPD
jgi:uncharacterized protein (TIGR03435 family)